MEGAPKNREMRIGERRSVAQRHQQQNQRRSNQGRRNKTTTTTQQESSAAASSSKTTVKATNVTGIESHVDFQLNDICVH